MMAAAPGEKERGKVTDEAATAGSRRQIDRPSARPSISLRSSSSAEKQAHRRLPPLPTAGCLSFTVWNDARAECHHVNDLFERGGAYQHDV